jgi:hypothetical protein
MRSIEAKGAMSALGQKQTFAAQKADVRFVPIAET